MSRIQSKQDRQIDALLIDHYDRLTHPPKTEPELNLMPTLNKLKAAISNAKPANPSKKPEPQP